MKTTFTAFDGKSFDTAELCQAHEAAVLTGSDKPVKFTVAEVVAVLSDVKTARTGEFSDRELFLALIQHYVANKPAAPKKVATPEEKAAAKARREKAKADKAAAGK